MLTCAWAQIRAKPWGKFGQSKKKKNRTEKEIGAFVFICVKFRANQPLCPPPPPLPLTKESPYANGRVGLMMQVETETMQRLFWGALNIFLKMTMCRMGKLLTICGTITTIIIINLYRPTAGQKPLSYMSPSFFDHLFQATVPVFPTNLCFSPSCHSVVSRLHLSSSLLARCPAHLHLDLFCCHYHIIYFCLVP